MSEDEIQDMMGHVYLDETSMGCGTDTMVVYYTKYLVRDNLIPEVKYMLSSIIFPLFYIGLVFLCVALTVLSVQQLSDSAKYRFRYGVLQKIGIKKKKLVGRGMEAAVHVFPVSGAVCRGAQRSRHHLCQCDVCRFHRGAYLCTAVFHDGISAVLRDLCDLLYGDLCRISEECGIRNCPPSAKRYISHREQTCGKPVRG